uniref:Uncharacterized protein n=1 Tax=Trichuris muris TaxID=70415 RepID=A0A5S6Q525_TRIMR
MCKGDAQLLLDGRMIPRRNIMLNSCLATRNFSGGSRRGRLKTGGPVVRIRCSTVCRMGSSAVVHERTCVPENVFPRGRYGSADVCRGIEELSAFDVYEQIKVSQEIGAKDRVPNIGDKERPAKGASEG